MWSWSCLLTMLWPLLTKKDLWKGAGVEIGEMEASCFHRCNGSFYDTRSSVAHSRRKIDGNSLKHSLRAASTLLCENIDPGENVGVSRLHAGHIKQRAVASPSSHFAVVFTDKVFLHFQDLLSLLVFIFNDSPLSLTVALKLTKAWSLRRSLSSNLCPAPY